MRLVIVVLDLGERFAGDGEVVGQVVIAGGDDQLAGAMGDGAVEAVSSMDGKVAVRALYALDRLVLAHVERVVLGDLAVVFEGLAAGGLLVGAGEGHVADLQQLGGGEEGHVRRIVEERVAKAALVDEDRGEARALRLDGAGHAGGAGADDEQIELGSKFHNSRFEVPAAWWRATPGGGWGWCS